MTKGKLDTGLENNSIKKPTELKALKVALKSHRMGAAPVIIIFLNFIKFFNQFK